MLQITPIFFLKRRILHGCCLSKIILICILVFCLHIRLESANPFCPIEFFNHFEFKKDLRVSSSGRGIADSLTAYAIATSIIREGHECTPFAEQKLIESIKNNPYSFAPIKLLTAFWKKDLTESKILTELQPIADNSPGAVALNLIIADYLVKQKKLNKAIKVLLRTYDTADFSANNTASLEKLGELIAKTSDIYLQLNKVDEGEDFWENAKRHKELMNLLIVQIAAIDFFAEYADKGPDGFFSGWAKRRYRNKLEEHLKEFEQIWKNSGITNALIIRSVLKVYLRYHLTDRGEKLLLSNLLNRPYNASAFLMLAEYYFKAKNYALSELSWKQIINSNKYTQAGIIWKYITGKDEGDFYFQLGNAAFYAEDYDEAIRSFNWYILLHPDSVRARLKVAFSYLFQQNWERSASIFKKISTIPQGAYYAAISNLHLNKYKLAYEFISKAETEAKKQKNKKFLTPDFYLDFANIADKSGNFDRAESILVTLYNQNHKSAIICNFLAYLWAEQSIELKKAEILVKEALKKEPENPIYLDTLAWVFYKQKQFVKAKRTILKAIKNEKILPDAVILDHAGDIFMALQDRSFAIKYWKQALTIYSEEINFTTVKEKIDKVNNSNFKKL